MITLDELDAISLRKAAKVLQMRSRKPNGWMLGVAVKVLTSAAEDIEQGKLPIRNKTRV